MAGVMSLGLVRFASR